MALVLALRVLVLGLGLDLEGRGLGLGLEGRGLGLGLGLEILSLTTSLTRSTCTGNTIHYPITSANKLTKTSTESTVTKLRVSQSESPNPSLPI